MIHHCLTSSNRPFCCASSCLLRTFLCFPGNRSNKVYSLLRSLPSWIHTQNILCEVVLAHTCTSSGGILCSSMKNEFSLYPPSTISSTRGIANNTMATIRVTSTFENPSIVRTFHTRPLLYVQSLHLRSTRSVTGDTREMLSWHRIASWYSGLRHSMLYVLFRV